MLTWVSLEAIGYLCYEVGDDATRRSVGWVTRGNKERFFHAWYCDGYTQKQGAYPTIVAARAFVERMHLQFNTKPVLPVIVERPGVAGERVKKIILSDGMKFGLFVVVVYSAILLLVWFLTKFSYACNGMK